MRYLGITFFTALCSILRDEWRTRAIYSDENRFKRLFSVSRERERTICFSKLPDKLSLPLYLQFRKKKKIMEKNDFPIFDEGFAAW